MRDKGSFLIGLVVYLHISSPSVSSFMEVSEITFMVTEIPHSISLNYDADYSLVKKPVNWFALVVGGAITHTMKAIPIVFMGKVC